MSENGLIFRVPDPQNPKESVIVRFEWTTEKNEAASDAAGLPQFDTILLAFVSAPGMTRSEAALIVERKLPDGSVKENKPVADRFRQYVDAFKRGDDGAGLTGTPLAELPGLDMALRATLKSLGVHSVESLAQLADTAANNMMGFHKYRSLAKAWVEQRDGQAPLLKLAAELDEARKENAALKAQNADILARVEALEATEPKGRKAA